jgi:hypothetical protein
MRRPRGNHDTRDFTPIEREFWKRADMLDDIGRQIGTADSPVDTVLVIELDFRIKLHAEAN